MWNERNISSEEMKLELRLGPPGEESINENMKNVNREGGDSPLTLGYFITQKNSNSGGAILPSACASTCHHQHNPHHAKAKPSSFLQLSSSPQNMPVIRKDASQPCCEDLLKEEEKNAFSLSSVNTAVPNRSQKRTSPGSVVGWPPIRSCRKNLASGSSSKPPPGSQQHQHVVSDKVAGKKPVENSGKALFVKINVDGVPIGRKVNINAYHSYEQLSSAVDELFRGLLADMDLSHVVFSHCCSAQKDSSAGGIHNKLQLQEEKSLIGSGEYALVYEDHKGDMMLVQDVPWHMLVSTVKRLRVLKSSDLPAYTCD